MGFTALHIFTVYYLGEKLARSSELYGTLGLAATVLFYLFLLGRGVVWAAELNAVVWGVRRLRRDQMTPNERETSARALGRNGARAPGGALSVPSPPGALSRIWQG